MWNKRTADDASDEPLRPQPVPAPIAAVEARPEPVAVRNEPARNNVGSVAAIGPSMKILGQIYSQEALFVDGEIEGSLESGHSLTVGQNGKVRANIKARDVTIFGTVKGNVEVNEKIAIREKGSLIGDIRTAGIVIDDGAYFKGSIDIMRPDSMKNGAVPPQATKTGT